MARKRKDHAAELIDSRGRLVGLWAVKNRQRLPATIVHREVVRGKKTKARIFHLTDETRGLIYRES